MLLLFYFIYIFFFKLFLIVIKYILHIYNIIDLIIVQIINPTIKICFEKII